MQSKHAEVNQKLSLPEHHINYSFSYMLDKKLDIQ